MTQQTRRSHAMTSPPANKRLDDRSVENTTSTWSNDKGDVDATTSMVIPDAFANNETPNPASKPLVVSLAEILLRNPETEVYNPVPKKPRIAPKGNTDYKSWEDIFNATHRQPPKRKRKLSGPRFACPFLQHNPAAHDAKSVCRSAGFASLPDLKQHLFRRHASLIQCTICQDVFSNKRDLDVHFRTRPITCMRREPLSSTQGYGILTMEQEDQLKARDKYKEARDDPMKRWQHIYRVIFPNTPEGEMPSPYYSPDPHFDFKEHLRKRLPYMVANGPTGNGLADLKDREELMSWVELCLHNAEKEYQRPMASRTLPSQDQESLNSIESAVAESLPIAKAQSPSQVFDDFVWQQEDEPQEAEIPSNS